MPNYDFKLGEWFKQVEKKEKELKAKKVPDSEAAVDEPVSVVENKTATGGSEIRNVKIESPAAAASPTVVATIESEGVAADTRLVESEQQAEESDLPPAHRRGADVTLFDGSDVPDVEDFFSFLSRPRSAEPADVVQEEPKESIPERPRPEFNRPEPLKPGRPEVQESKGAISGDLSEGTGEPRPIVRDAQPQILSGSKPDTDQEAKAQPVVAPTPQPKVESAPVARVEVNTESAVTAEPADEPQQTAAKAIKIVTPSTEESNVQANWDRIPHHLQTLFSSPDSEIAQNSYKTFKESRGELIQRLLDPVISLEEAARVLNVCPTTVRRYTNRGVLHHIRTAGNQRRFRLSDVLVFMENGPRRIKAASESANNNGDDD